MTKQEREALLYQPKHGRDRLSPADEAAMQTYCEAYKAFLDRSKTERECVVSAVELAEKAGFRELTAGMALKAGDKVYSVNRGKSILLAVIGKTPLSEGANTIVVTAADAAGKLSTVTRNVTLDTSVPQIVSASVVPNPADAGATVTITVTVVRA